MRISRSGESSGQNLSTADLAAASRNRNSSASREDNKAERRPAAETAAADVRETDRPPVTAADSRDYREEALVALFTPELTETYRSQWISIQSAFVDDPRQAVRSGDELVAQVMTNLANSFAQERRRVEGQLNEPGEGSTENLRVALRRYRSFFERLLSL